MYEDEKWFCPEKRVRVMKSKMTLSSSRKMMMLMENVSVNIVSRDLRLEDCKYVLNDYEDELKELGVSLDDDGSSKWVKDKEGLWIRFHTYCFSGLKLSPSYRTPPRIKVLGRDEDSGELLDNVYGNVEKMYESEIEELGGFITDEQKGISKELDRGSSNEY